MTKEEQRQALIDAIADADPDDVAPHYVYADWLYEQGEDDSAEWHRRWTPEVPKAMKRIEEFAASFVDEYEEEERSRTKLTYDQLMESAKTYLDTGKEHWFGYVYDLDTDAMDQFWKDFEIVTGRGLGDKYPHMFRCSC